MDNIGVDVNKRLLKEAKRLILSPDDDKIVKGLKHLKRVIKSDPENSWAFVFYGVGASKSDKHRHEAVQAFEAASQLNPDLVECWKGIRACLEVKNRSEHETNLLADSYCNLLRLEDDLDKWLALLSDIKESAYKISVSLLAQVLSSMIEDFSCKDFKHKVASKELSDLAFLNESLLETNPVDVFKAFQGFANFLDFCDRPEYCKKVCNFLTKLKHFSLLSDFLYHTILVYGTKEYLKIQLIQFVIDIAFDCLDNVEKLIPLVKTPLKEVENVTGFHQIKLALCIVHFFEEDFSTTRDYLENLSCMGDVNVALFLLKFLCKARDYEGVLFLCLRFTNMFSTSKNDKLIYEYILCLLESLSSCNEVALLEYAIKIGLKTFSKFGEDPNLIYFMSHCYLGLQDPRAVFYMEKVKDTNRANYLMSILKCETSGSKDLNKFIPYTLLSANFDLISNNVKRALKNFTKVGVKDKCISEPFLILGVDSLARKDIERAASCFHRAFSLRPMDADILKYYLDSLFKLEKEERALQVLDSVWNSNFGKWHLIGEKALFASGLIHSAKLDHEKSVRSFKHLIKLNPDCLEFVEAISDEYIHLGRLGIAENYVSRLISEDPYDLHPLLLLSEIYKLDVNFSAYFNNSVNCLNTCLDENEESIRVSKLIICFFINFFNQNVKLEEFSHNYIRKLGENALKKIDYIVSKGNSERTTENEYLVALYKFIESHFLAAVKVMKLTQRVIEVKKLIGFCIEAISRVIKIYGAGYICFWKLLGDIFLLSSQLPSELPVLAWLVDEKYIDKHDIKFILVPSSKRIELSLRYYALALNLVSTSAPLRQYEFYYDISLSLAILANHPETEDPELRYLYLKASLVSCLKSFVNSDGVSSNRWIHSTLLGVIVSLLGIRENMFKDHFSSQELKMNEGLMLQNYATHLAKSGLLNRAEETYEQARLRVDMDYASSWVGQLLMQLINKDIETKKMLEYNLTQIGNHPLLKWILAYYFAKNKPGLLFHGGQYSLLNHIFPEEDCIVERNPYRLSLMAYIHELIGNLSTAKRLYIRVLRLAKHVEENSLNSFISNAIRVNPHCRLNFDLLELLDNEFSSASTISLYHLSTHHLSIVHPNRMTLLKSLVVMRHLLYLLSSEEQNTLALVIPLLNIVGKLDFVQYKDIKLPFIYTYFVKNIIVAIKCHENELKKIISTMDSTGKMLLLKNIYRFITLNKFTNFSADLKCIKSNISVSNLIKNPGNEGLSSSKQDEIVDWFSMGSVDLSKESGENLNFKNSKAMGASTPIQSEEICPYKKTLTILRKDVFPLPLSDEERRLMKRNKILNLQTAITQSAPNSEKRYIKREEGSYMELVELHGCHSSCELLISLLRQSITVRDNSSSLKYAHLCLDIKCTSCLDKNSILPVVCYVSVETKNCRLIQRALHLYPSHPLLRKTILWFISRLTA